MLARFCCNCAGAIPRSPSFASQLDHHQRRLLLGKQRRQARQAARGGVAADRGVHHPVVVTFVGEALLQQGDPALAGIQSQSGADTIAHDQQRLRRGLLGQQDQGQAAAQQQCTHRNLHERQHSQRAEP